jgi:hypothetical protein
VSKRVKLGGCYIPIWALAGYVLAGPLMFIEQVVEISGVQIGGRLGFAALLAAGWIHLHDKQNRTKAELLRKIDQVVGPVWDAGERAGRRHAELEAAEPELAAVREFVPRG